MQDEQLKINTHRKGGARTREIIVFWEKEITRKKGNRLSREIKVNSFSAK